jgi:ribonuclease Z
MEVRFLGVSGCIPDVGGETASFVLAKAHLVDTGWCGVLRMRELGLDPLDVRTLLLTHLHHDHTIGLPQWLFYHMMHRQGNDGGGPLRILGPGQHLAAVVEAALALLQVGRFPELQLSLEIVPLYPGDGYDLGEVQLETRAAKHTSGVGVPEPSLCWRATDKATGAVLVFTGDTSYDLGLGEWAQGAKVLLHDSAHTSGTEAAQVAKAAAVERLYLIHSSHDAAARALVEARIIFPETYLAQSGEAVEV